MPALASTSGAAASVMRTDDGLTVQVQLLQEAGYPRWPTEVVDIEQRYFDVRPARMRVLTAPAFGAAKMSAWLDRKTSRDLFDLSAMAKRGLITAESFEIFARLDPFTRLPEWTWATLPSLPQWREDLGHQLRLSIGPEEAAEVAKQAWDKVAR